MERTTYAVEAEIEASHWWFTERRRLFSHLIRQLGLTSDAKILDIGTSTGTNLRMLRTLGFENFQGLDASPEAIRWCAGKGLGTVTEGDICALPFEDNSFDLILATDVIEHVDDDAAALCEIRRTLKSDGRVLITVPAFMILWGLQDEVSHHKRRYRAQEVLDRMRAAGFHVFRQFYFNYVLFFPIMLARVVIRMFNIKMKSENEVNNDFINRVLRAVFRFDVWSAPMLRPPFGVSYLVLATKTAPAMST